MILPVLRYGHPSLRQKGLRVVADRPSTMTLHGEPVEFESFMPLVLVNPELKPVGDPVEGAEGCLSFPEIYAPISRPHSIEVKTTNEKGQVLEFGCGGLLARAIQHEYDHLQGILFIDRMTRKAKLQVQDEVDVLQAKTKLDLKKEKG
jgi:peptide deformylase